MVLIRSARSHYWFALQDLMVLNRTARMWMRSERDLGEFWMRSEWKPNEIWEGSEWTCEWFLNGIWMVSEWDPNEIGMRFEMRTGWGMHEIWTRSQWNLKVIWMRFAEELNQIPRRLQIDLNELCMDVQWILNWIWMVPEWFGMDLNKLCMSSGWSLYEVCLRSNRILCLNRIINDSAWILSVVFWMSQ